jgi:hypothetical protein
MIHHSDPSYPGTTIEIHISNRTIFPTEDPRQRWKTKGVFGFFGDVVACLAALLRD